jgi:hypothetical protein
MLEFNYLILRWFFRGGGVSAALWKANLNKFVNRGDNWNSLWDQGLRRFLR